MLVVESDGLKYCRLLSSSIDKNKTNEIKENFDYVFVVSYNAIIEDTDFQILEKNACLFNVDLSNEEIVKNFNATGRNEYRRTFRTDGLAFHFGYDNFDGYYEFYKKSEHARNWFPIPKLELENSILFTASFEGEYISGMSCYSCEETIRVSRIYSTKRINQNPKINGTIFGGAAKRLVIEICDYARKNGFKYVDLGGIDLSGKAKSGISEFKLSLGGEIVPVKIGRYMKPGFADKQKELLIKGIDIT
jgi:hypothetical protein